MEFHHKPNTFVGNIDLKVENFQRSLSFYQNLIGFKVLEKSERKAVLTADGRTPLVVIEQPEKVIAKQPRTTGLYHYALLLPERADLAKALKHLLQNGYPLQGASDHLVSEALYLADPDGNGIEIYVDRPASTWNWENGEVEMATQRLDVENLLTEGQEETWQGLPAGTIMGHIHLHVSELVKTEQFYHEGLGFDVVTRYGNQALFMSTGKYHHHIGLNTWNGVGAPAPEPNSVGMKDFSLLFANDEARNKVIENLKGLSAKITEEKGDYLTIDPSGNSIKLMIG